VQWIWFQGPYKNKLDGGPEPPANPDPKHVILWKIHPPNFQYIPMDQIPLLSYGKVPTGWEQEFPINGSPPESLKDGYVYYVQAVSPMGPDLRMCFAIKNGEAYSYEEVGENQICGKH
jgi:hypothetical protein